MLKLTPDPSLTEAEAAALRAWRGSGRVPEVLAAAPPEGALLLEAIEPGTPLADAPTAVGLDAIAAMIRELHAAPAGGFEPLAERLEFIYGLARTRRPERADLVERSRRAALRLDASAGERVLLHGDLHPANVLDGGTGRGPVAIDPRACVGDPAVDLADWALLGPLDAASVARRAARLARRAGADPTRALAWVRCTVVLMGLARPMDPALAALAEEV
jgi:streptomycin 6-kinase